jgi:hypothetical protein
MESCGLSDSFARFKSGECSLFSVTVHNGLVVRAYKFTQFIHGDLCIMQNPQCSLSSILLKFKSFEFFAFFVNRKSNPETHFSVKPSLNRKTEAWARGIGSASGMAGCGDRAGLVFRWK